MNLFIETYFDSGENKAILTTVISRRDFPNDKLTELYVTSYDLLTHSFKQPARTELNDAVYDQLAATYTSEFVRSDGLTMLTEYLDGASGQLPRHEKYGQLTFCSDL